MDKPFVKVVWLDASDPQDGVSWHDEAEAIKFGEELCEVISWGYLVHKTKLYVTLGADRITKGVLDTTYGRLTKIPAGMVQSVVEIGDSEAPAEVPLA